MVRVFSIYQFDGQSIHRIPDDILSASLIDANHLALAKSDHVIEIVSLQRSDELNSRRFTSIDSTDENNIHTKYAFPTVDEVAKMVYCKFGNFIATVECKTSNSGVEHSFLRVYTNWTNCKTASNDNITDSMNFMTCNVTIRARIAGRVTPSTNNMNCLEVIEIPTIVHSCSQSQSSHPYELAVCQRTGTIVCANDRFLKIYKFDECVNENTHFKYIDFLEVPFEVELDFIPTQLSIDEHIVGTANSEYMCVFKISEHSYFNTANSLTTSSSLSVMAPMPVCPYVDTSTDSVFDYQNASKKFLTSITSNISSTFDHQSMEMNGKMCRDRSIELKPNNIDSAIPLCTLRHFSATNDDAYKDYMLRILVQVKQHDANDPFQCLVLSPIYSRKQKESETSNLFRTHNGSAFIGISVLLATVNEGYLYQFSNNEKWTINENDAQTNGLIATYSFTSPIINVCVTDYVIHALTDHGIETYTHSIGHKLFNNIYEYSVNDEQYNSDAAPRLEEQICLIGLRPFLGVQRMFHTPENLILLARSLNSPLNADKSKLKTKTDSMSSWTLYSLKMSPPDVLYKDFIELAANHKTGLTELITSQNSDKVRIYSLLLSEGHVILRIAKDIYTSELNKFTPSYSKAIDLLFLESCHQLADFYVMSQNRDQYCLAYPYYVMGDLKLNQVYNRIMTIIGDIPQDSKSMVGAVHTLKTLILKSTDEHEELARRLTSTVETSTNRNFGEKLMEFFAKYAPNELAAIGLNSIIFRDTMGGKMCEIILQTNTSDQLTKEDKLILILDAIRCDRKDRALDLLDSFNAVDLHHLLMSNWSLLFETTTVKKTGKSITTFSEVTESYLLPASIKNHAIRSALLATFRNLLIDSNVLNIELILKLFMDFLATNFGQINLYMSVQSILEHLLEAYFHRLYVVRRYSDTLSSASQDMLTTKNMPEFQSRSGNNNDSLGSTSSDNATTSIGLNSINSGHKMNDSTQSEMRGSSTNGANDFTSGRKHPQNLFSSSFNAEALKILTRIYLSSLKSHTNDLEMNTDEKSIYIKYVKFLRENFNRVYSHHISQNTNCDGRSLTIDETRFCTDFTNNDAKNDIKLTKIPILFLLQRPSYLNAMPPIGQLEATASSLNGKEDGFEKTEKGSKAIGVVLKLQSLLSSGILTRDILKEVLHFIESNIPFFGVDSFLALLMPFEMCIDYLIEMRPEYLLDYAKCASTDEQKWQYVLTHITMQFDRISQNRSQTFYETLLKDHLDYLVHTKRLPEVLNIVPMKYFDDGIAQMISRAQEKIDNGENVENAEIFPENNNNALITNFLKSAIDTDRSERLNEMIKTTGFQLYNTFIGGNHPDTTRSAADN
ncbi:uncharacterized protein LOC116348019 [Contarinia nasturtii]|uniref:uncharacterized protein LOC116348019 n=1 Tax=Contarinia nasturtii TaxID=265458 RepID=UPI0012D43F72|nr:uncharacterized protein LOC116348019 [Contarinia nasturtii]XP_031634728.1 uncharacterized protein LOC116348019 [Contarinia nasturtii]